MNYRTIAALALDVHSSNVAVGWWPTPYPTGQDLLGLILRKSNLIHAEAAEATEAHRKNKMDDHLPEVHGVIAEMADVAIRSLDMLGFIGTTVIDITNAEFAAGANVVKSAPSIARSGIPDEFAVEFLIATIHKMTHDALDDLIAKGDAQTAALGYVSIVAAAEYVVARLMGASLDDVIKQKRAYNAARADHKPEARAAAGGKSY